MIHKVSSKMCSCSVLILNLLISRDVFMSHSASTMCSVLSLMEATEEDSPLPSTLTREDQIILMT